VGCCEVVGADVGDKVVVGEDVGSLEGGEVGGGVGDSVGCCEVVGSADGA